MDPNATLTEALAIAKRLVAWERGNDDYYLLEETGSVRLAELVLALDGWIHGADGFLPDRWNKTPEPTDDDCDCAERSWYGDEHDSACPLAGRKR